MNKSIVAAATWLGLSAGTAWAQTVSIVPTEGDVTAVVQTPRGSYVETTRGTFRLESGNCETGICLTQDVIRGLPQNAPDGALPDGKIAQSASGDIRQAWYGKPTDRYAHCVLGDCIEGGSLVVQLADGSQAEFVLPDAQVFEDITPRLFDFGGDGTNEVVTIRASKTGGGAVVVYGFDGVSLVELAASTENGRPNRWLNIIGIQADSIEFIRTPHIGGRHFSLLRNGDGSWKETDLSGNGQFSNHLIGSRELGLGYIGPSPFHSGLDLVLPVQSRDALWVASRKGPPIKLPSPVDKALIAFEGFFVTATQDGQLLAIKW